MGYVKPDDFGPTKYIKLRETPPGTEFHITFVGVKKGFYEGDETTTYICFDHTTNKQIGIPKAGNNGFWLKDRKPGTRLGLIYNGRRLVTDGSAYHGQELHNWEYLGEWIDDKPQGEVSATQEQRDKINSNDLDEVFN